MNETSLDWFNDEILLISYVLKLFTENTPQCSKVVLICDFLPLNRHWRGTTQEEGKFHHKFLEMEVFALTPLSSPFHTLCSYLDFVTSHLEFWHACLADFNPSIKMVPRIIFKNTNLIMLLSPSMLSTCSYAAAAAAKSLQSCPTLCDPTDGSPPGSPIPGILQARTLEWVAIPFSNAWKWKVTVKSLSRVQLLATPWTAAHQAPPSMGFSRQEYWSGVPLPSLCPYDEVSNT